MNDKKNKGPKIKPWGIPKIIDFKGDLVFPP